MRCRPPSRRADRSVLVWLLSLLLTGAATAADATDGSAPGPTLPAGERLVLSVTVNGAGVDAEPVLVRRRGTAISMRTTDLRALGIAVRGDAVDTTLGEVPGLAATIDDRAQVIALTWRAPRVRAVNLRDGKEDITPNGWGAALNYDLAATRAGGRTTLAALVDGVVYGPRGYFYGGAVASSGGSMTGGRRATLLDVGYTTADPASARRVTLGHLIAGAAERSRPIRMLGVQVATDFSLRPDLITTPLPDLDGAAWDRGGRGGGAAVPTATDVIVNGQRARSDTTAGSFAIADLTVRNGVNTVTTTVRDALGRETRQTLSTYVSPVLLRPGLTAFSAEAGLVRRGYGGRGGVADLYGPLAGSATWRVALGERLTVETHAELSARVGVGGLGATLGLGAAGLVSVGAGVSAPAADLGQPGGHAGVQWGVGYERVAQRVSVAARYTRSGTGWRDIAGDSGTPTRAHVAVVTLGFDLARLGNVGITVIDQGHGRPGRSSPRFVTSRGILPPSRFVTASWSARLTPRLNIVANGGIDTYRPRSGYLSLGALLVVGSRQHGYAGLVTRERGTGADVQWRRAALGPGDWGMGAAVARGGGIDRQVGDLTYQGLNGRYVAEVERVGGTMAARVSARGAVAIGGSGLLAADRLNASFAVVDTGQADVTVFRDHRPVGRTDRRGRLIIADLPAFVATTISVDPQLLPDDVTAGAVERRVRPANRAGVPVRFDIVRSRAATARLLLADGRPVPAGARATLNDGAALPVGLDGDAYLPALAPRNTLRVTHAGLELCSVTFDAPPRWRPGGAIGQLTCAAPRLSSLAPSATRQPPR